MIQTWDRRILTRMQAAQAQTQRHLGVIERQIAARAARCGEIDALLCKLDRQERTMAEFRTRNYDSSAGR
jgi:hypothetical protein